MSTTALAVETVEPRPRRGSRARSSQFVRVFCRDRQALLGLVIIAMIGGAAMAAPLISPWDPLGSAAVERLAPIGTPGHVLGTDEQGRDILSRLIWGGRASLMVGILPTVAAGLVALLLGLLAGDLGGVVDHVIMRVLDVFFAFPLVLLAIAIVGRHRPRHEQPDVRPRGGAGAVQHAGGPYRDPVGQAARVRGGGARPRRQPAAA